MALPLKYVRPIIGILEFNSFSSMHQHRLLSMTKPIYCLTPPPNNNQRDPDKWLYKRIWFTLSTQFSKAMQTLDRKCIEHKNKLSAKTQQLKTGLTQSIPMESESYAKRYKELWQTKRNEFYTKTIEPKQLMLREKLSYSRCVSRCYFARYGQPILDIWWSIICSVRERILQIQNNDRFRRMMVIVRTKSAEMMTKINQCFAKQNFLKKSQKKIDDNKNDTKN